MSNSSNGGTVLAGFSAETLLGSDAHVIKEITALRNDLRYTTNGSEVSLDDSFMRVQKEVDALPCIVLDMDVPPGTENEYLIRLSTAQEKVLDDCDRVLRHILEFQSKLKNAERAIKKYRADFLSWYVLAASYEVEAHKVKFAPSHIKGLAEAEFTRLIDGIDVQVDNLISSVEHLIEECRQHKKIQSEKHSLGKDQANASWTSKMANPNGIAPSRADQMAQEPEEEELDEDEVPAFVSRRPQVGSVASNPVIGTCNHVPTPTEPWLGAIDCGEPPTEEFPVEELEPEPVIDTSEPTFELLSNPVPLTDGILGFGEDPNKKIVASNQDLLDEAEPGDTVVLRFQDNVAPVLDGIKDTVKITGPVTVPFVNHIEAVAEVRKILDDPNLERNYVYRDPTPGGIIVADPEQVVDFLNADDPEPVAATPMNMKPRKRLILMEDEDLM